MQILVGILKIISQTPGLPKTDPEIFYIFANLIN